MTTLFEEKGDAAMTFTDRAARFLKEDGAALKADIAELETLVGKPKLIEECGVFGVIGTSDAAALTALGLHALQHRGQEAAGIASFDGQHFHNERFMGLVSDHFSDAQTLHSLAGDAAIGHTRYSTQGETVLRNVQPLYADLDQTGIAIAHNGNLTNSKTLRADLVRRGCIFQSTSDSEIFLQLTARSQYLSIVDKLIESLKQVEGAYALTVLTPEGLIGARDPVGIRPLILGDLKGAPILASETCALDMIGATALLGAVLGGAGLIGIALGFAMRDTIENYVASLLMGYQEPSAELLAEHPEAAPAPGLHHNPYFPNLNLAMAPPLTTAGQVTYDDGTEATVEQMSEDVAAFLTWTAEPRLVERKQTGWPVLIFLLFATVLANLSKKQIWAGMKPKKKA